VAPVETSNNQWCFPAAFSNPAALVEPRADTTPPISGASNTAGEAADRSLNIRAQNRVGGDTDDRNEGDDQSIFRHGLSGLWLTTTRPKLKHTHLFPLDRGGLNRWLLTFPIGRASDTAGEAADRGIDVRAQNRIGGDTDDRNEGYDQSIFGHGLSGLRLTTTRPKLIHTVHLFPPD